MIAASHAVLSSLEPTSERGAPSIRSVAMLDAIGLRTTPSTVDLEPGQAGWTSDPSEFEALENVVGIARSGIDADVDTAPEPQDGGS